MQIKPVHYDTSKEEMILMMQDASKDIGSRRLKAKDYDRVAKEKGFLQYRAIRNEFGTWDEATKAAGLDGQDMKVTKEKLIKNFQDVYAQLGRQPKAGEMCRPLSRYTAKAYKKHFNTDWGGFLQQIDELSNGKFGSIVEEPIKKPSPVENTHDVFISYAREDSKYADEMGQLLSTHGVSYWIDRKDILGGQSWPKRITSAIRNCTRVALLVSKRSMQSENVIREIQLAIQEGKHVLPVIIEDVKYSDEIALFLQAIHKVFLNDKEAILKAFEPVPTGQTIRNRINNIPERIAEHGLSVRLFRSQEKNILRERFFPNKDVYDPILQLSLKVKHDVVAIDHVEFINENGEKQFFHENDFVIKPESWTLLPNSELILTVKYVHVTIGDNIAAVVYYDGDKIAKSNYLTMESLKGIQSVSKTQFR